jgi:uncharacterized membrane protein YhhN
VAGTAYFSAVTVTLLIVAAALAVGDWVAVQFRLFRIEFVLKPATLGVLVAAAAGSDLPGTIKPWAVAALALGLLGDVGLMLSGGRTDPPFLAGLSAFLLGHVAYIVAFTRLGLRGIDVVAGALVVAGIAGLALPAVLRGAARSAGPPLALIVAGYAGVLSCMTVLGIGTGCIPIACGAALFLISDTLIARDRFVARLPHGSLLIIVTYHAAQFLIIIGLLRAT